MHSSTSREEGGDAFTKDGFYIPAQLLNKGLNFQEGCIAAKILTAGPYLDEQVFKESWLFCRCLTGSWFFQEEKRKRRGKNQLWLLGVLPEAWKSKFYSTHACSSTVDQCRVYRPCSLSRYTSHLVSSAALNYILTPLSCPKSPR